MREAQKQAERRHLWQGFGDGLTSAVEMAVTPVLFALLGHWLDGRFGIEPVLTVTLFVFATAGSILRAWVHFNERFDAVEEGKPWRR